MSKRAAGNLTTSQKRDLSHFGPEMQRAVADHQRGYADPKSEPINAELYAELCAALATRYPFRRVVEVTTGALVKTIDSAPTARETIARITKANEAAS